MGTKKVIGTKVINVSKRYRFFKRFFDLFMSSLMLIVLFAPLLVVTIIQLFVTKGHPFFADPRIGRWNKPLKVLKFRSMVYDAESNIDGYLNKKQKKQWLRERVVDDDPRVTKFGEFLRKTSIDEFPQLINIFIGNMSFVGPRPMSRRELDNEFTKDQRDMLLEAKPGLTGNWQVNGRNNVTFESGERQRLELEYIYKRGFWFDAKIFLKTIPTVIGGKGAR